jgi:hypothetical protein
MPSQVEYVIFGRHWPPDQGTYTSYYDAFRAILDTDAKLEAEVRQEFHDSGIRHDRDGEESDWIFWNGDDVLSDFGYRIQARPVVGDKP